MEAPLSTILRHSHPSPFHLFHTVCFYLRSLVTWTEQLNDKNLVGEVDALMQGRATIARLLHLVHLESYECNEEEPETRG